MEGKHSRLNKTCFVADTPTLTPDGYKPIQEFRAGDAILSRPEDQPVLPVRPSVVEELFALAAPILEVRLGGQTIETTAEHPFFVAKKGWVRAEKLEAGDELVGHDDHRTKVDSVTTTARHETVYNVRVAEDHTYFVGDENWGFSVWVHNAYKINQLADGTWEVIDGAGELAIKFASKDELLRFYNQRSPDKIFDFENVDDVAKYLTERDAFDVLRRQQAKDLAIEKRLRILDQIDEVTEIADRLNMIENLPEQALVYYTRALELWELFDDLPGF